MKKECSASFVTAISLILRRYLEARFHLNAPDQTTEEIFDKLKESPILSDQQQKILTTFLQQADIVKFAKGSWEINAMEDAFNTTRNFIQDTAEYAEGEKIMIRFAEPLLLLLLFLIPIILYFKNRRIISIQYSRVELLRNLPKSWKLRIQPILPILYTLGLITLVIAIARPQKGIDESIIRTEAVDIILLLDLSESMDTRDFNRANQPISRLDASKEVIEKFLKNRPNDRIGMVGFASLPYAVAPLTLDHLWLTERMMSLHTDMLDGRRTAIGDGIASAINRLRDSDAKSKVIILLTDGENNTGSLSPENAATAANALDIKIYTIGAAGPRMGFFSAHNEIDEEMLMELAKTTNGKFYRARNLASLEAIYDEIDNLEKTEIEVEQYTRYQEVGEIWILLSIILLSSEQILSTSKIGRLP